MASQSIDLTGQRFGRLLVLSFSHSVDRQNYSKTSYWLCRCDCGTEKLIDGQSLKQRKTKSCGCLRREKMVAEKTVHGMTRCPSWRSWAAMLYRCQDPNNGYYGGRGIAVCDRWRESFENFYADMGDKPEGLSLDRIDNDGNYEPGNCRWATRTEQCNNQRSNRMLVLDGRSQTLAEWSKELGVNVSAIRRRLIRGWSIKDALTTPVRHQTKTIY